MQRMLLLLILVGAVFFALASGSARAQDPQPGCKLFGQLTGFFVSQSAHTDRPLGQEVRTEAPLNDELAFFKSILCN